MERANLTRIFTILTLLSFSLLSAKCPTSDPTTEEDICDGDAYVHVEKDANVSPGENFYLEAPPGENECHAKYTLVFRYLDDGLALLSDKMPPIDDLTTSFGPAAEFSYFPHGAPVGEVTTEGFHIWRIHFDAGNRHSGLPSTEHSVNVNVPSIQENPEAQPLKIYALIEYRPVKKKS